MGLFRSMKSKFSGRNDRKLDNSAGIIPSLSNEAKPVSRRDSITRKPLPARAKVEPNILNDNHKPGTPPKDNVRGSTIRLVGEDEIENATSRSPTGNKILKSNGNRPGSSNLDPRTYWGPSPSSHLREDGFDHAVDGELPNRFEGLAIGSDEDGLHELDPSNGWPRNRSEGLAVDGDELGAQVDSSDGGIRGNGADLPSRESLNAVGVNLEDTVDTDRRVTHAPAITHETIHNETTEIIQESITREIHEHDHYHYVQPIQDVEVLPERHFMRDINGHLFEIPEPSGHEVVQKVVGETYVDMAILPRRSP